MSGRSTLIEMLARRLGAGAQRVEESPQLRTALSERMQWPDFGEASAALTPDDTSMVSLAPSIEPPTLRNALADVNANRARPDAGGGQGEFSAGAMTALRRELREHDFDVPASMPDLPQLEVPLGDLRSGRIGSLDSADARRYAALDTEAPPILVRRDRNGWHIIDGNRRVAAARMRGDGSVRAVDASDLFRTQPDGGGVRAGRQTIGSGRSKTVYADPQDPSRVVVEMAPDPVTEAFLQFSRDAHARGLPFARHLPNPDAVESAGDVVRYRTERLAPNDTRARVGRENGGFFITGVDDAEQSGSIIAAMNALDDHLRRTLSPNTPRHFYDLGPQNFMRRADGTLVINDPVESTGFPKRAQPNAGPALRALRDRT